MRFAGGILFFCCVLMVLFGGFNGFKVFNGFFGSKGKCFVKASKMKEPVEMFTSSGSLEAMHPCLEVL